MFKFISSIFSKTKKRELFDDFQKRGLNSALSLGISVPEGFPISTLCEVFYEGIYNMGNFKPQKSDVVIDIGANTGDWTIYCSKVINVKKIYAFEPLKYNYYWAKNLLDINRCENTTLYNYAISDFEGERKFEYTGNMLGEINTKLEKKTEVIKFKTLDSFKLQCDILKIDVEGFELDVLKGSLNTIRNHKPKIILETHTKKLRQECNDLLNKEGYRLKMSGRKIKGSKTKNYSNLDEIVNLYYSYGS